MNEKIALLVLLVILVALVVLPATAFVESDSYCVGNCICLQPGDANCDGEVDMGDVTKVERIILELDPPTLGADANRDGEIDIRDVTKIERIILQLD